MAFRSIAGNIQHGTTNSLACVKPVGLVAGDTLIAILGDRAGSNTTTSAPDGSWARSGSKLNIGTSAGSDIWIKTADATDQNVTVSYTFTWSANNDSNGGGSILIIADDSTKHAVSAGPVDNSGVASTWTALTATPSGTPATGTAYACYETEGSMTVGSIVNSSTGGWTQRGIMSSRGGGADTIGQSAAVYSKAYTANAASGNCDLATNLGIHYTARMITVTDSQLSSGVASVVII